MWNILIVDDEVVAVEGIRAAIDREKFHIGEINTACDIQEARQLLEKRKIHILICDIEMPGGSGLELLEWVNAHQMKLINIILTSHADFSYAQHAVGLDVMKYLLKPASDQQMDEVLQKAVEKLKDSYRQNDGMRKNQTLPAEDVLSVEAFSGKKIAYQEMDGELIGVLLYRKKYNAVYDYMKHHLEDMLQLELMQDGVMKCFCEDAGQIFYRNFPDFTEVFHEGAYLLKKSEAHLGVKNCLAWIQYTLEAFKTRQQEQYRVTPVDGAMEYIEKHLDGELSCKTVASYVGMHQDYLSRLMKKEKGMTLQQYIDEKRLEKAKELLKTTDIPVNTIAQITGYRHYTYFSTYFKKCTNLSPTKFRGMHQNGEEEAYE